MNHDPTPALLNKFQKELAKLRKIVSTIGTAPYETSKYLVEIIQPTLSKNKHRDE